jgi:hypothetical protein
MQLLKEGIFQFWGLYSGSDSESLGEGSQYQVTCASHLSSLIGCRYEKKSSIVIGMMAVLTRYNQCHVLFATLHFKAVNGFKAK